MTIESIKNKSRIISIYLLTFLFSSGLTIIATVISEGTNLLSILNDRSIDVLLIFPVLLITDFQIKNVIIGIVFYIVIFGLITISVKKEKLLPWYIIFLLIVLVVQIFSFILFGIRNWEI